MIAILTAVAALALVPFGDVQHIFGQRVGLYGIDVSIGPLYVFAFGGISFYGIMLGGWASGSKYSFLGAMRGAAQLISYEVSQGLALVGVVITAQTLSLTGIVHAQGGMWYFIPQFAGFLIFMVASFAETNRAPFDLVEADAELVGGLLHRVRRHAVRRLPVRRVHEHDRRLGDRRDGVPRRLAAARSGSIRPGWVDPIVVLAKMMLFITFFIWIRATLPRLRYDQLMSFGWKILLPLATLNLLVTAISRSAHDDLRPRSRRDRGRSATRARGPAAGAYRAFGETLRGLKTTFARIVEGPSTIQYPEEKTPVYPRFRGRHKLHRFEDTGPREVRRLLALRRRLPGRLHPRRRGREHAREPRLGRRALRRRLRDQPQPLHLLRLLRGRLPVRRDHHGPRLRDVRLHPLGPDLHQGDAAGRADRAHAAAHGGGVE